MTAGDDTFNAGLTWRSAMTVSALDQVTGGAGSDTVKVYGGTTLPAMTGVEAVEVHHTAMVDMNLSAGALAPITSVTINGAEASDKTITIKAGDTIHLEAMTAGGSNCAGVHCGYCNHASADVSLTDMSDTTGVILDILGTGITTLNITEAGTVSTSYADILADTASVTSGNGKYYFNR